jgi:outer membrane protein assembly factor BamB
MPAYLRVAAVLCLAATMAVPAASAWNLQNSRTPPAPEFAAWTIAFGRISYADSPDLGTAAQAVTCALGDIDDDGVGDLLVHVKDTATGLPRLKALSGPDFQKILWQVATRGDRYLQCAPDLNLDGLADPVMTLASQAGGTAGASGAVKDESVDRAMQVLDGASGESLIRRQHKDTQTTAGPSMGSTGASADSSAQADLLPATAGAEVLLKTEVQQSQLLGLPDALPVAGLTATARHAAEMQLLDAQGAVHGTIKIDSPGVDPLALAPIPMGRGLPNVAALTAQTVSPVKEAASQVPTLSLYNPDGSLAWSVALDATEGLPVLLPRAGDLNLDGVEDIIVENVPTDVQATAAGQFRILSGLDGQVLLDSGSPVKGLMAALPLGALPDGTPTILSAKQVQGSATLTLSVLDATGKAVWSLDVEPGSIPVNARLDAYTGDPLGFTDLTGDGLPDIGVAAKKGGAFALQAIDGATGQVAWTASLADVDHVVPVSPGATLGQVTSATRTIPGDLLAIGPANAGTALTLLDGATGKVVWTVKGALPAGAAMAFVDAQAAGDLNKDGVQDVLATVTATTADGDAPKQAIYALSGLDGETMWANATDPAHAEARVELANEPGPGYQEQAAALAEKAASGRSPASPAGLVMLLLVTLVWVRRRRA